MELARVNFPKTYLEMMLFTKLQYGKNITLLGIGKAPCFHAQRSYRSLLADSSRKQFRMYKSQDYFSVTLEDMFTSDYSSCVDIQVVTCIPSTALEAERNSKTNRKRFTNLEPFLFLAIVYSDLDCLCFPLLLFPTSQLGTLQF